MDTICVISKYALDFSKSTSNQQETMAWGMSGIGLANTDNSVRVAYAT